MDECICSRLGGAFWGQPCCCCKMPNRHGSHGTENDQYGTDNPCSRPWPFGTRLLSVRRSLRRKTESLSRGNMRSGICVRILGASRIIQRWNFAAGDSDELRYIAPAGQHYLNGMMRAFLLIVACEFDAKPMCLYPND